MNNEQNNTLHKFCHENPHALFVEDPKVMDNETFGPTVYFCVRYGTTYMEYGIKPNGDLFKVN